MIVDSGDPENQTRTEKSTKRQFCEDGSLIVKHGVHYGTAALLFLMFYAVTSFCIAKFEAELLHVFVRF